MLAHHFYSSHVNNLYHFSECQASRFSKCNIAYICRKIHSHTHTPKKNNAWILMGILLLFAIHTIPIAPPSSLSSSHRPYNQKWTIFSTMPLSFSRPLPLPISGQDHADTIAFCTLLCNCCKCNCAFYLVYCNTVIMITIVQSVLIGGCSKSHIIETIRVTYKHSYTWHANTFAESEQFFLIV